MSNLITLSKRDLFWCVKRLPKHVRAILKEHAGQLMVAGGFIRACVANEEVNDIDLMAPSKHLATVAAYALSAACNDAGVHTSKNAFTVKTRPTPVQFVHRWTFSTPQAAIDSFDFTIARAAIWWDGSEWCSVCDENFYPDLAAKRLVYCAPVRIEEVGGSMLRVLKFYQRGYRIPVDSLAAVMARVCNGVDFQKVKRDAASEGVTDEQQTAKIITSLLREVDPQINPDDDNEEGGVE